MRVPNYVYYGSQTGPGFGPAVSQLAKALFGDPEEQRAQAAAQRQDQLANLQMEQMRQTLDMNKQKFDQENAFNAAMLKALPGGAPPTAEAPGAAVAPNTAAPGSGLQDAFMPPAAPITAPQDVAIAQSPILRSPLPAITPATDTGKLADSGLFSQYDPLAATISARESSGDPTAQNPNSTASGNYGYIDSTWQQYGGQGRAKDATPDQQRSVLNHELDMLTALAKEHSGQEPTTAELGMMHQLGAGAGLKALASNPDTLVSDIIGADAMAVNPQLKGVTVGQLVQQYQDGINQGSPIKALPAPQNINAMTGQGSMVSAFQQPDSAAPGPMAQAATPAQGMPGSAAQPPAGDDWMTAVIKKMTPEQQAALRAGIATGKGVETFQAIATKMKEDEAGMFSAKTTDERLMDIIAKGDTLMKNNQPMTQQDKQQYALAWAHLTKPHEFLDSTNHWQVIPAIDLKRYGFAEPNYGAPDSAVTTADGTAATPSNTPAGAGGVAPPTAGNAANAAPGGLPGSGAQGPELKITGENAGKAGMVNTALNYLDDFEKKATAGPGLGGKAKAFTERLAGNNPVPGIGTLPIGNAQPLGAEQQLIKQSVGRIMSGAQIKDDEWRQFDQFTTILPADSPETVKMKLGMVRSFLSSVGNAYRTGHLTENSPVDDQRQFLLGTVDQVMHDSGALDQMTGQSGAGGAAPAGGGSVIQYQLDPATGKYVPVQ